MVALVSWIIFVTLTYLSEQLTEVMQSWGSDTPVHCMHCKPKKQIKILTLLSYSDIWNNYDCEDLKNRTNACYVYENSLQNLMNVCRADVLHYSYGFAIPALWVRTYLLQQPQWWHPTLKTKHTKNITRKIFNLILNKHCSNLLSTFLHTR